MQKYYTTVFSPDDVLCRHEATAQTLHETTEGAPIQLKEKQKAIKSTLAGKWVMLGDW